MKEVEAAQKALHSLKMEETDNLPTMALLSDEDKAWVYKNACEVVELIRSKSTPGEKMRGLTKVVAVAQVCNVMLSKPWEAIIKEQNGSA